MTKHGSYVYLPAWTRHLQVSANGNVGVSIFARQIGQKFLFQHRHDISVNNTSMEKKLRQDKGLFQIRKTNRARGVINQYGGQCLPYTLSRCRCSWSS